MTSWWLIPIGISWGIALIAVLRNEVALRRQAMVAGIPGEPPPRKPISISSLLGGLGVLLVSGFLIYKSLASMHVAYELLKGELTSYYQLLDTSYLRELFVDLLNRDERNLAVQLSYYTNGFFLPHRVAILLSGAFQALYFTVRPPIKKKTRLPAGL